MDIVKKSNVPLEEALTITGSGWYTRCLLCVSGLVVFTGFTVAQAMSIIIPAAGCDLNITSFQKGILTSMGYTGMLFSTHLFGFLADTYGRRKVIFICSIISGVLVILSSLAPNAESLMVAYFIIGFVVGGIFAPAYVYASEFCPASTRATGLLVCASFTSIANMFLGGLAWLLLPVDINILLFGGLEYKSWRLFLTLLSLPPFLSAAVIYQFPDTPKYLLNAGNERATIEVLKSIYSVNMRKNREDFPVSSVCLDGQDQGNKLNIDAKMSCFQHLRNMIQQTAIAFSPKYILYMLISCASILVIGGIYNVVMLWLPEETRKLSHFMDTHTYYNVTLCDVMSSKSEDSNAEECAVNHETYIPNILVGAVQLIFFYLVILIVNLFGAKPLLVLFASVSAVASVVVIFSNIYYITLLCLGSMAVLFSTMFPIFFSIIVGYFPTSIRSNATSIVMLFGRTCSVVGSQILGSVFYSSCEIAYGVISALVIGNVFLCMFMPIKRH